ncbi:hypothetical protein P7C70_g1887, partial [Phenoliferia sp. Uapishka_3]
MQQPHAKGGESEEVSPVPLMLARTTTVPYTHGQREILALQTLRATLQALKKMTANLADDLGTATTSYANFASMAKQLPSLPSEEERADDVRVLGRD